MGKIRYKFVLNEQARSSTIMIWRKNETGSQYSDYRKTATLISGSQYDRPESGIMNTNVVKLSMCLMMNALLGAECTEKVRGEFKALRLEGFTDLPHMNHNVMRVPSHAPRLMNEGITHLTKLNDWARPSLSALEVKSISWEKGLRVRCSHCASNDVESWLPRNAACRVCRSWYSEFNASLRDHISTAYEPQLEMFGIRLVEKVRGARSWRDERMCFLRPTLRRGTLRNGDNAECWEYSGLTAWKVAFALDEFGLHEEASKYWAMPQNKQIHRVLKFYDYFHDDAPHIMVEGCIDASLTEIYGIPDNKARDQPRRTLD